MDWQEITALSIVALTVGGFVWSAVRARSHKTCGCGGCSESGKVPPSISTVYRWRKGERPTLIIKSPKP